MRGSWGPNITEIFWPRTCGRQRCVFLVLYACSTGPWSKLIRVLAFPTTLRLLPSSTVLLALLLAYLPPSSIRRPYITFKLPRSNIDTPQRLRNLFRFTATGMCHFLPVHHLEWHFWLGQKVKTEPPYILEYQPIVSRSICWIFQLEIIGAPVGHGLALANYLHTEVCISRQNNIK